MSQDYNLYKNLGGGGSTKTMPVQTIPTRKKKVGWVQANAEYFYWEAIKQLRKNSVFGDIRNMANGEFTYTAVDLERTLHNTSFEDTLGKFKKDMYIPTHLKHFDFIGIIANAIIGAFGELDDLYRVESDDDYATNDFIRAKTERLHQYAQKLFELEVNKLLLVRGIDPEKEDFQSQEEQQQYIQMLEQEVKKLSPFEIEKELATNFKVLATDWANNVLKGDKRKFGLDVRDKKALTDFILTGRWFRHYKVGYDYYNVEDWMPEEVFFDEQTDTLYPQDCDYIGKLTQMSSGKILERFGHLMTTKQQEAIGNYFNQDTDYDNSKNPNKAGAYTPFVEAHLVPFENYYDHKINLEMESALGAPLAQSMDNDGNVTRHWMPTHDLSMLGKSTMKYRGGYRKDIDPRRDVIEVMEVYWKSSKRMGVLVYRDDAGNLIPEITTDDLLQEFIEENEIKTKRNQDIESLKRAFKEDRLDEFENTRTYVYIPEVWHMIVLKGSNSSILEEDIILDARPLDYQIKGDSNFFEVKIPVGGIITNGQIAKILPYQQLHNVCLNQITELISDEPGVFYTFDINAIPAEYKDQTTEEVLFSLKDTIKLTKMVGMDLSRTNTQGSTVYPNVFQRNEVVFKDMVVYRRDMAEYFKQQAYQQVGITPQMLGAPSTYVNEEGIQQQATATYNLMSNIFDDFNLSRAKSNELHIAIAQFCETNGISNNRLIKNSDGQNHFIDILAEDPEYFPLRKLNVLPANNSKDRKIVQSIQGLLINDNTIQKDFSDIVDIFTNPYTLELRQIGRNMKIRQDQLNEQQRQFEDQQVTKQLQAQEKALQAEMAHEVNLTNLKGEWKLKEAYLTALGRDSASTKDDNFGDLTKAYKTEADIENANKQIELKERQLTQKENMDTETKKKWLAELQVKQEQIRQRQRDNLSKEKVALVNYRQ